MIEPGMRVRRKISPKDAGVVVDAPSVYVAGRGRIHWVRWDGDAQGPRWYYPAELVVISPLVHLAVAASV